MMKIPTTEPSTKNTGPASKPLPFFRVPGPAFRLFIPGQEKPNHKRLEFFEKDFIDWEGKVELHDFYKTLLTIRKRNKALQESASVLLLQTNAPETLAYLCRRQNDRFLVVMNLGKKDAAISIDHPALPGKYTNLFSGEAREIKRTEKFNFQPGEYLVYQVTR
jgi:glycosidase